MKDSLSSNKAITVNAFNRTNHPAESAPPLDLAFSTTRSRSATKNRGARTPATRRRLAQIGAASIAVAAFFSARSVATPSFTVTSGDWTYSATPGLNGTGTGTTPWTHRSGSIDDDPFGSSVFENDANTRLDLSTVAVATGNTWGATGVAHLYFTLNEPTTVVISLITGVQKAPTGTTNSFNAFYDNGNLVASIGESFGASVTADYLASSISTISVSTSHAYELESWAIVASFGGPSSVGYDETPNGTDVSIVGSGTPETVNIAIPGGFTITMNGSTAAGKQSDNVANIHGFAEESAGTVVTNAGTLDMQGEFDIFSSSPVTGSLFENTSTGTVLKSAGTGTSTFYVPTTIDGGTFNVASGAIAMNGTLTIGASATWTKTGTGRLVINGAQSNGSGFTLTVANGTLDLNTDAGASGSRTLALQGTASGAYINLGTSQHLSSLALTNGAKAKFASGGSKLLITDGLSVDSSSQLDLTDQDAIIHYSGSTPFTTLRSSLHSGYNNQSWTGNGITSSTAAAGSPQITGIGIMEGTTYRSIYGTSATFDGEAVDTTSILLKYTYYGDTDFNGHVNFDDYARIDNHTGWRDFNHSGTVNFDDYALMDAAFNQQGGTLGRAVRWLNGSDRSQRGMDEPGLQIVEQNFARFGDGYAQAFLATVPEPTVLGTLASLAITPLLRRRRNDSGGRS